MKAAAAQGDDPASQLGAATRDLTFKAARKAPAMPGEHDAGDDKADRDERVVAELGGGVAVDECGASAHGPIGHDPEQVAALPPQNQD